MLETGGEGHKRAAFKSKDPQIMDDCSYLKHPFWDVNHFVMSQHLESRNECNILQTFWMLLTCFDDIYIYIYISIYIHIYIHVPAWDRQPLFPTVLLFEMFCSVETMAELTIKNHSREYTLQSTRG